MYAYYRGHVDDAACLLAHHDGGASVDKVEGRLQVHVDYHVPLLFRHTHHQSVARNTGVVYQNIDAAKVCVDSLYYLSRVFKVGGV